MNKRKQTFTEYLSENLNSYIIKHNIEEGVRNFNYDFTLLYPHVMKKYNIVPDPPKKSERRFNDIDPYGEENWEK